MKRDVSNVKFIGGRLTIIQFMSIIGGTALITTLVLNYYFSFL